MQRHARLLFILALAIGARAAERADAAGAESLAQLARQIRPDFLLGSFASGLDFSKPENPLLAEFFRRNFAIMTVGVYLTGQPKPAYLRQAALLRRLAAPRPSP